MRQIFLLIWIVSFPSCYAQKFNYNNNIQKYIDTYVAKHEVVKAEDKKYMQFFPVNKIYKVIADFEPVHNAEWFNIPTSSGKTKLYRKYGKLTFKLSNATLILFVYQAQALLQKAEYLDYLFLPFSDQTNGHETYETGRYIDLKISEISNNKVIVDFNKAYNPYCAYVSGVYNCPVPPFENFLKIPIKAGEKKFVKTH